jgi:hypothetical protein
MMILPTENGFLEKVFPFKEKCLFASEKAKEY